MGVSRMTERHLDLLQKHRELQNAFDDTLEMNRKLGSENWKLEKENEKLKENIKNARKKLFDILTDYEIGNYDNNIHQFYKAVYAIHNELMDLAE